MASHSQPVPVAAEKDSDKGKSGAKKKTGQSPSQSQSSSASSTSSSEKQMRVVMQKFNSMSLQVDPESDRWIHAKNGVCIFVTFLRDATTDVIPKAVSSLLNLRYFGKESIVSLGKQVIIVPQATLGGRMKGKMLQYHANIDKAIGADLFREFCDQMEMAVNEQSSPRLETTDDRSSSSSDTAGNLPRVQWGTFGNIQRMRDVENDGPFTHVFEF